MDNNIEQLVSELLQQAPELRGREEQLRSALKELLSARPNMSLDGTFRAELKRRLMAHGISMRPAWYATWHRAYYPLIGAALVALLLMIAPDRQSYLGPESTDMAFAPRPASSVVGGGNNQSPSALTAAKNMNISMEITSSAFQEGQMIPKEYTCDGEGLKPLLDITDVPANAQSLVLVVQDPDAPSGTFTHWIAWNIPPTIQEIGGALMIGGMVEGSASNGTIGWVAPCPPNGTHHYVFTLFALNSMIALPVGSSVAQLDDAMTGHVLAETSLTGLYQCQ